MIGNQQFRSLQCTGIYLPYVILLGRDVNKHVFGDNLGCLRVCDKNSSALELLILPATRVPATGAAYTTPITVQLRELPLLIRMDTYRLTQMYGPGI